MMCNEIDLERFDAGAATRLFLKLYGEEISEVTPIGFQEIQTYGVNYGTNYDDDVSVKFQCIIEDSYRTMTSLPVSLYILASSEFSLDYITQFDFTVEELEALSVNEKIDDKTRAWISLQ